MLTLVDGVKIVVPNSLNLITPYVLREQPDFFEDELKSVSKLIGPGQKVIDLGANYGVYTLPQPGDGTSLGLGSPAFRQSTSAGTPLKIARN